MSPTALFIDFDLDFQVFTLRWIGIARTIHGGLLIPQSCSFSTRAILQLAFDATVEAFRMSHQSCRSYPML
jgi:hypothetical protein